MSTAHRRSIQFKSLSIAMDPAQHQSSSGPGNGSRDSFELALSPESSRIQSADYDLKKQSQNDEHVSSNYKPLRCRVNPSGCAKEQNPSAAALHWIDLSQLCRLDGELDLFPRHSRSSSFRLPLRSTCSYGSSAERESRDSSRSSRSSHGRFGEPDFFQVFDKKDVLLHNAISTQGKAKHCSIFNSCAVDRNDTHCARSDHSEKATPVLWEGSRRWSWKGLWAGLQRKASKLWIIDDGERAETSSNCASQRRAVFTFKELPDVLGDGSAQSNASYQSASREASMEKANQAGKRRGAGAMRGDHHEEAGAIYCLRSGGRQQEASFHGGAGAASRGKARRSSAMESWSDGVRRAREMVAKLSSAGKLVPGKEMEGMAEASSMEVNLCRAMKAKSLSSSPLARSPAGSFFFFPEELQAASSSPPSPALKPSSCRKKTGGFPASCPASMACSPRSSSLLSAANNVTALDLQSAIQGAIAHCKRSQAQPPTIPLCAAATPPP